LELVPVADNTISENNAARTTFDSQTLIVGRLGAQAGESRSRSLLLFDVTSLPMNATVTAATLTVTVTRNHLGGADVHGLDRLNSPWTEQDATWTHSGLATLIPGCDSGARGEPGSRGSPAWTASRGRNWTP